MAGSETSGAHDDPCWMQAAEGDCIGSLAFEHGLLWKTVWDHGENSDLKQKRKNPNTLLEGDWVYVPDIEVREESCASEARHKFKRKGVPVKFVLQLMRGHEARKNLSYILIIDGESFKGTTDSQGRIEQWISPGAKQGEVRVKEGDYWERSTLRLGSLPPGDHEDGVRHRLRNLGYIRSEDEDEDLGDAVREFQKEAGIEPTGKIDKETSDKLMKVHDDGDNGQQPESSEKNWEVHPENAAHGREMISMIPEDDFDSEHGD